jgi:hypothetical protein
MVKIWMSARRREAEDMDWRPPARCLMEMAPVGATMNYYRPSARCLNEMAPVGAT